jgi:ferrous iron transport protein B
MTQISNPASRGRHKYQHQYKHRHKVLSPHSEKLIALVGNPNVGKSVIFGYLTGIYTEVSNYPGTTVETASGKSNIGIIVDTPGIYGVSSFNDEEQVARDIILDADILINVVDATNLERDLFLTLQLCDMGIPMVVALNMMDEAEREGLEIDVDLLSDLLGVPVIPTVAVKGQGLVEIEKATSSARPGHSDPELSEHLAETLRCVGSRAEAVLVLEGDEVVSARHGIPPGKMREEIYLRRRERVNDIVAHVVKEIKVRQRIVSKIADLSLNQVFGVLMFAGVMFLLYEIIGVLIAQKIVGYTEGVLMKEHWEPLVRSIVYQVVSKDSVLGIILAGKFGVLTMTVTYLFGLLLPLVIGFYISLSVLEDSGYLPRLAVLADRALSGIGLNGRAVIPIILGFGCVTMGTITTRILGSARERTIATSILNFTIPCSAQLGVIALFFGRIGWEYGLAYVVIIGACLVIIGTVLNKLLPGESTSLLTDLPPMRIPRLDNVIRKTFVRTKAFMKEAYGWFFVGSLFVSILQVTGVLALWERALIPLTVHWLQLPAQAANAFILGMIRRDFGAAGFTSMMLTPKQTLVAMVTITLFVPCIASVAILFKERGYREAIAIWLGAWCIALLVGGITSQLVIH